MSSPLQGVRQGRPWEGRDRRQNNYADDDIVIFEEVLSTRSMSLSACLPVAMLLVVQAVWLTRGDAVQALL